MKIAALSALLATICCAEKPDPIASHVFAWPFIDQGMMTPRGGSTDGTEVELITQARRSWELLNQADLTKIDRDRRAILAMAGNYRVSFDFLETFGFTPDYHPPKPYFSWGTEHVEVIEDNEHRISLQHALVMYFTTEDGTVEGPAVMKHLRQDWTYEPENILVYQGDSTWKTTAAPSPSGRWSQSVWQVDDSPRYEVMGTWTHENNLHTWQSDKAPRPLPRREFSSRNDYDVLTGKHTITIGPTGWLHQQSNQKLHYHATAEPTCVGLEIGVNRYEAISSPELAPAFAKSWNKTENFWREVRNQWRIFIETNPEFKLHSELDGKKLWQHLFEQADRYEGSNTPLVVNKEQIRSTLESYLEEPSIESGPPVNY